MDLKDIQTLIRFISSSGVDEVTIERKDFKLNIRKNAPATIQVAPIQHAMTAQVAPAIPQQIAAAQVATPEVPVEAAPASKLIEIKSPMIGTFYRSAGPDKPLFVSVGDEINVGDTVCIIEAMKLFNEIESEFKGKIVKVMVEDSTPVEYDQVLFLVDPS